MNKHRELVKYKKDRFLLWSEVAARVGMDYRNFMQQKYLLKKGKPCYTLRRNLKKILGGEYEEE